jgi:hypothetical protein
MYELPVMVNFSCKVRVALVGGLENDLIRVSYRRGQAGIVLELKYLGAIGQFMRCQVDFPERSLPNQSSKSVVANGFEVMAREFATSRD